MPDRAQQEQVPQARPYFHLIDGKLVPCRPEMEVRQETLREVEEALFSDRKIEGDLSFLDILLGSEHGSEEVDALREAWKPLLATLKDQPQVDEAESSEGRQVRIEALTERVMERFRPTDAEWDLGGGHMQAINWSEVIGQILHYADEEMAK